MYIYIYIYIYNMASRLASAAMGESVWSAYAGLIGEATSSPPAALYHQVYVMLYHITLWYIILLHSIVWYSIVYPIILSASGSAGAAPLGDSAAAGAAASAAGSAAGSAAAAA